MEIFWLIVGFGIFARWEIAQKFGKKIVQIANKNKTRLAVSRSEPGKRKMNKKRGLLSPL